MFPSELWPLLARRQVEPAARWLFVCLFLHPETDSGGFLAWQPKQLGTMTGLGLSQVERAADHLQGKQLLVVDRDMERLWLAPFMEYDTSRKPNMYVSALRAVRECPSRLLKAEAWREVQRIHPPPMKLRESTSPETKTKLLSERQRAYEELQERIDREMPTVSESFVNRSGTVGEPPTVTAPVHVGEPAPKGSTKGQPPDDIGTCATGCEEPAGHGPRDAFCQSCAESGTVW